MPLSLQAVYDDAGRRAFDAMLYVFSAGTATPVPAYADAGLGNRRANPMPLTGSGIIPVTYLPDGAYRFRATDPNGVTYFDIDGVTVVTSGGSGGGGGGSVDPNALVQTGDIVKSYRNGTRPGYVRANGRTIGSAASSATERANADCHDLFVFLWTQDANLAVAGGRGANAESDWAAAKTIALPDTRSRLEITLDDLGNTAAGRLNGGLFTFGNATTLGAYGGEASHTQTLAELAYHGHSASAYMDYQGQHQHNGSTNVTGDHAHASRYTVATVANGSQSNVVNGIGGGLGVGWSTDVAGNHGHTFQTDFQGYHAHNITVSVTAAGSNAAMNWLPPFILVSSFIKL